MNTDLRTEVKNDFEKYSINFMNFALFEETMENIRKRRDIRPMTTEARRIYLVSEPNYYTISFPENLLAMEMRKTQILPSKPLYLGLSIKELGKTLTYEFWYDYVKPKYAKKLNCVIWIQTDLASLHT